MVAGGHLDFLYPLVGPIPAGAYVLQVTSAVGGLGTTMEAELADVNDAGFALVFDTEYAVMDGGTPTYNQFMNVSKVLPLVDAGCGDTLRLRISMSAGPDSGYIDEIQPTLTIP